MWTDDIGYPPEQDPCATSQAGSGASQFCIIVPRHIDWREEIALCLKMLCTRVHLHIELQALQPNCGFRKSATLLLSLLISLAEIPSPRAMNKRG